MSRKRLSPTLRSVSEADSVVLGAKASGHQDAETPRMKTHPRKSGARLVRKTLYMDEELAIELGVYAARQMTSETAVVGLALRRLLGRE